MNKHEKNQTESHITEALPRAKEVFKDKAEVLIGRATLLGLSQAKFNGDSSQKKKRGIIKYWEILSRRLFGLSYENRE